MSRIDDLDPDRARVHVPHAGPVRNTGMTRAPLLRDMRVDRSIPVDGVMGGDLCLRIAKTLQGLFRSSHPGVMHYQNIDGSVGTRIVIGGGTFHKPENHRRLPYSPRSCAIFP